MSLLFRQPDRPDQPLHGVRYYLISSLALGLLGALYLLWAT